MEISLPLPVLPGAWAADKDFKAGGPLHSTTDRVVEPVGPHFLAYARRKRHKRTFSEDERIQAQTNVKQVEDEDPDDVDEPEDPLMLQREAKDWKVRLTPHNCYISLTAPTVAGPLRCARHYPPASPCHRGAD
jgi:DnaJ family protein C protein 2